MSGVATCSDNNRQHLTKFNKCQSKPTGLDQPGNSRLNCPSVIATLDSTVCSKLDIPNEVKRGNNNGNGNTNYSNNIGDIIRSSKSRIMPKWNRLSEATIEDRLYVEQLSNGTLQVWLRELPNSNPILLLVTEDCMRGICNCMHYTGGREAQLRPCRAFVELFLRG